jgi:beta-galactosidase
MGCRTLNDGANAATPIAEYFGVMIGQDPRTDALTNPTAMFRAYSAERRDRAPFIETEDFRDEAARRFWDDFSPPHFGFKKGPNDTYNWNSETFCLAAAERYHAYFQQHHFQPDPAHSKWSGYASIYWSDSNADGRQDSSEVCRVSGKVDSVRLPKQAYYVYRVMQSATPDIHIIGHWNYPTNTVKTIYVAANHCDSGGTVRERKIAGQIRTPVNGYIFAFPEIKFEPGKISAVAKSGGKIVAQDEIETAGEAKRLKLTPHVWPERFAGRRFGRGVLRRGSGGRARPPLPDRRGARGFQARPARPSGAAATTAANPNSVNNLWLDTECGINRVAIRSTLTPGAITLTATRDGLEFRRLRVTRRYFVPLKDVQLHDKICAD